MTLYSAVIIIVSLVSISISIANILMVRKMAKRNKELQERLAQQRRSVMMLEQSGPGCVWYDPNEQPKVTTEYRPRN